MDQYEKQLEAAAEVMGQAIQEASAEVKSILLDMKQHIDKFVDQEASEGKYMDRSALFSACIIGHPQILDEKLIAAAKGYIDSDYLFIKHLSKKEEALP